MVGEGFEPSKAVPADLQSAINTNISNAFMNSGGLCWLIIDNPLHFNVNSKQLGTHTDKLSPN